MQTRINGSGTTISECTPPDDQGSWFDAAAYPDSDPVSDPLIWFDAQSAELDNGVTLCYDGSYSNIDKSCHSPSRMMHIYTYKTSIRDSHVATDTYSPSHTDGDRTNSLSTAQQFVEGTASGTATSPRTWTELVTPW